MITPGFTSPLWIGWALVLNVCSIGRLWHLVSHLPCRNVSLLLDVSIADKLLNRYSKCSCLVEAVCVCVGGGGGFVCMHVSAVPILEKLLYKGHSCSLLVGCYTFTRRIHSMGITTVPF